MNEPARPKPHSGYSRAIHRARQHDSAHAEAFDLPPQRVVDHPLVPRAAGELITTEPALAEMIEHIRRQKSFAYDSEFIGELNYHPRLCVLQVATTQRIGLIDPMAKLDLTPFWQLLSDESIQKVMHAGEQDVEPVHRLTGRPAANVFDTQIAAGFVGLSYPIGLSKLVQELIGTKLGKGLTFTHWDQRPLSPQQLSYAADDVRYLPAVAAELQRRLESRSHAEWCKLECRALCDPKRHEFDPDADYLRLRGATGLTPQGLAVLRELNIWRDAASRKYDVPPRALLRDEILLDMARSPVKSVERLERVKGLPRPLEASDGSIIVAATLRGLAVPIAERPASKQLEPAPSERFAADSLFALLSAICAGRSIDPALVTSRQEVGELHRALISGTELPSMRLLTGWRAEACSNRLVDLFRGKGKVELTWQDGQLRASP